MREKVFRVLATVVGFMGIPAGILFIIWYFKREPGIDWGFFIGAIVTLYFSGICLGYGLAGYLPRRLKSNKK